MPDELAHARGWFLKAESDFTTAKNLLRSRGPYDTACFHAQQPAEKYLKGLLVLAGKPFPPTHNLEDLQRIGETALEAWPLGGLDLAELTPYAVQLRYDFEFWPDRTTAEQALQSVAEVRRRVLHHIPPEAQP